MEGTPRMKTQGLPKSGRSPVFVSSAMVFLILLMVADGFRVLAGKVKLCGIPAPVDPPLRPAYKRKPRTMPGFSKLFSKRYLVAAGFRRNSDFRLSKSSILAPWRFMITACCVTDRVLFHAQ